LVTGALQPPVVESEPFDGGAKHYEPVKVEDAYGDRIKEVLIPALKRIEEGDLGGPPSGVSTISSSSLECFTADEESVEESIESVVPLSDSSDGPNTGSETDSGSGQDIQKLPGAYKPLYLNLKWNNHPVPRKLIVRAKARTARDEEVVRAMLQSAGEFVEIHRAQAAILTEACERFSRAKENTYEEYKKLKTKRQTRQVEDQCKGVKIQLVTVKIVGYGIDTHRVMTNSITNKKVDSMFVFDTQAKAIVGVGSCTTGYHLVHEDMVIMPSI
jgi:hypothetical protein